MSHLPLKNLFTIVKGKGFENIRFNQNFVLPFATTVVVNTHPNSSFVTLTSVKKTRLMLEIIKILENTLNFRKREIISELTEEQVFFYETQGFVEQENLPFSFEDDGDFVEPPDLMVYYNYNDECVGRVDFHFFMGGSLPYADNYAFTFYS